MNDNDIDNLLNTPETITTEQYRQGIKKVTSMKQTKLAYELLEKLNVELPQFFGDNDLTIDLITQNDLKGKADIANLPVSTIHEAAHGELFNL